MMSLRAFAEKLMALEVGAKTGGRIVSISVIIAVGVNTDGQLEVLGIEIETAEAEPIWTEFLRNLTRRGLRVSGSSSPMPVRASRPP